MKTIRLSQGKYAIVDDDDYEKLFKYKWTFDGRYACRWTGYHGERIAMHQAILNVPTGMQVDHKNRDKLDYRKENLRIVTSTQQNWNKGPHRDNIWSDFKGVFLSTSSCKWRARITVNKKTLNLGTFNTQEEAALAYNEAARRYHGEFAYQNIIPSPTPEPLVTSG